MVRRPHSRRLTWIAIGFGAFLLADLLLFGWLLLESLSEREVNRALLETREEAEGLAQQLALEARRQGEDLYVVIAKENETKTSIDSVLRQREIIRSIEIRDREGRLVYSREVRVQAPGAAGQTILSPSEVPSHYQIEPIERTETFEMVEVDIPIEDFGQITLGISREQLAARAEALRRDLIARTSVVGGLSLTLLIIAWAVVVWFARRGERLEELAAERERMAYLGTLAAGLAHEIRNPLNSLNLNMQLIEEEMQHLGRGATPRLLTITRDEIGRLERLVTDFLAYARPRAPERGVVDLTELLERVRDQVAAEAREAGASIVVEADEELALVADRAQLQQLLLNVVRNACSAVAAGGKPGTVTLAMAREGQFVRLDVVDTGVGIPADAMPHIFEVFWSTKKGGTGLGLAIADRIARAHGGEVQVTSTVGEGTRVRLLLPFDTTHSAPVKAS
jgi:signal transduction histidine kinase